MTSPSPHNQYVARLKGTVARLKKERKRHLKALEEIRDTPWSDERVNPLKHIAREAITPTEPPNV